MISRAIQINILCLLGTVLVPIQASAQKTPATDGSYRLCDFHQHTTFTDGSFSINKVFAVCDSIGLAWWANSEHGGPSRLNGILSGKDTGRQVEWTDDQILGDKNGSNTMWRWQTIRDYSFPYILSTRTPGTSPVRLQGMEWNVPGHEHASMCILDEQFSIRPTANPVAQFEYRFDNRDLDKTGGKEMGWIKSSGEGHAKALEGLAWLQEYYPQTSWVIPAHPDRQNKWSIADFRDCNNTAPDVCFGFEGIPGHQASPDRGEYAPRNNTYGTYTYGGTGWMCARIGGLWDALLSEGRRWWLFSCSDFHDTKSDFYPGEYNKTYVHMPETIYPKDIAGYLRSGNSFVVAGNFVSELNFHINGSTMGETCFTSGKEVQITIEVRQPDISHLPLHHIDLIAGVVSGYQKAGTSGYQTDSIATTRVIARFDNLVKQDDGVYRIQYTLRPSAPHTYYRLRGTHLAPGTPGETDTDGNPLPDVGENKREKALNDQWFYSNPIFVKQIENATEIVVHRGANHLSPENTAASAMKAIEHGASWIELDVRSSQDGILYNLHDGTLDRTTDGKGPINQMHSSLIDKLDAGSWFSPDYANTRVPRIAEMLDLLKGKANVFFDVKETDLQTLISLVREKGFESNSFFWFGNPCMLMQFVALAPEMNIKVNASTLNELKQWMRICKPTVIEIACKNITPEIRSFCKNNDIKIMATVLNEDSSNYKEVIFSEADMVNLDQPEVFQEVIRSIQ